MRLACGTQCRITFCAAAIEEDNNCGFRLLNPAGNKFISTGASLNPALRKSTEPYKGGGKASHCWLNQISISSRCRSNCSSKAYNGLVSATARLGSCISYII